MMIQLTPEQISKFWDMIRYAVENSLPPIVGDHPDKMSRILSALLSGKAQCWASYIRDGEKIKFEGVAVTRIVYDDVSGTKNLLIYCIYGYDQVDKDSWADGLKTIAKFASGKGCLQIIAYTEFPYIVKMVEKLGGSTSYTFLRFNVDQIVN